MGNCMSRIHKDPSFVYEEMKNDPVFSKGLFRLAFYMSSKRPYTGGHSLINIPEIMTLAPLQTEVWWRGL